MNHSWCLSPTNPEIPRLIQKSRPTNQYKSTPEKKKNIKKNTLPKLGRRFFSPNASVGASSRTTSLSPRRTGRHRLRLHPLGLGSEVGTEGEVRAPQQQCRSSFIFQILLASLLPTSFQDLLQKFELVFRLHFSHPLWASHVAHLGPLDLLPSKFCEVDASCR